MRFDLKNLMYLRKQSQEGCHNIHKYNQDFDTWWRESIVLRMDVWPPFAGYFDAVEAIQRAAWQEEIQGMAEGK
mgnify:CR=1 FL=1